LKKRQLISTVELKKRLLIARAALRDAAATLALRGLRLCQRLHHRAAEGVTAEERVRAAVHGLQQRFFGVRDCDVDVWGHGHAAHALRESDPELEGGGWRRRRREAGDGGGGENEGGWWNGIDHPQNHQLYQKQTLNRFKPQTRGLRCRRHLLRSAAPRRTPCT
jgi:hypothetical protein